MNTKETVAHPELNAYIDDGTPEGFDKTGFQLAGTKIGSSLGWEIRFSRTLLHLSLFKRFEILCRS